MDKILKLISKLAFNQAKISANQACTFFSYQEKVPASVKQLRKF